MLASYAVIPRRSAMLTAPVAVVMIAVSAAIGGVKGLVGALLGVGLVAAFFGISTPGPAGHDGDRHRHVPG
jgi:ATP synthase protein I